MPSTCSLFLIMFSMVTGIMSENLSDKTPSELGYVNIPGAGKYLVANSLRLPWAEAQKYCKERNGQLPEFQNIQEENIVTDYVVQETNTIRSFWLGVTDQQTEGVWRLASTNISVSYTNWLPTQPDNEDGDQNCVEFIKGPNKWSDFFCGVDNQFICQYTGESSSTVDSCEGIDYKKLDDPLRNVGTYRGNASCDGDSETLKPGQIPPDWEGAGWYRFTGPAGIRIPEQPPGRLRCGTSYSGWLNGTHPATPGQEIEAQICFEWKDSDCQTTATATIRNCGDYFLYNLKIVPNCNARYCGTF